MIAIITIDEILVASVVLFIAALLIVAFFMYLFYCKPKDLLETIQFIFKKMGL